MMEGCTGRKAVLKALKVFYIAVQIFYVTFTLPNKLRLRTAKEFLYAKDKQNIFRCYKSMKNNNAQSHQHPEACCLMLQRRYMKRCLSHAQNSDVNGFGVHATDPAATTAAGALRRVQHIAIGGDWWQRCQATWHLHQQPH